MNLEEVYRELSVEAGPRAQPEWGPRVERWYQLDGASYALITAYWKWKEDLQLPSVIVLASPKASLEVDQEFVHSSGQSPTKFVFTLPNIRVSPLLQVLDWHGPVFCIQKGPETWDAALLETQRFVSWKYPSAWLLSVRPRKQEPQGFAFEVRGVFLRRAS